MCNDNWVVLPPPPTYLLARLVHSQQPPYRASAPNPGAEFFQHRRSCGGFQHRRRGFATQGQLRWFSTQEREQFAVACNTAPTANRASVIGGLEGRRLCGPASSEGFKTSLLIALSHRAHMYGLLDGRFLGGMLLGGPFKVYAGL